MITTAVVKQASAVPFNTPCITAPSRFCSGVWVGCNKSKALVTKTNAVEFNNYSESRSENKYRMERK